MILRDLEWLCEIFNDTKRRAVSLQQLLVHTHLHSMLPLILIILSRLDRGIQSATEMLPLKRGGTGLLHIVLTAPSRLHSSAANSSTSVKFCVEAKAIFSEFQQWDRYSRSTERISCFLCISSSSSSSIYIRSRSFLYSLLFSMFIALCLWFYLHLCFISRSLSVSS